MGFRSQYDAAKVKLLADPTICEANRQLFTEFFAFQEYKLKRQNGLSDLDDGCYKTLYVTQRDPRVLTINDEKPR